MKMNHFVSTTALLLASGALMTFASAVHAADLSVTTDGEVSFIENTDTTDPLDPIAPENPIQPVHPITPTAGPLSIDYASSFHFGENKISAKDEIYYAHFDQIKKDGQDVDRPNWVQVSDKRGTNAGWKLQVQQGGQFTTGKGSSAKVLKGAELSLSNPGVQTTPDNQATAPTAPEDPIVLTPGEGSAVGAAQDVLTAQADQGMGTWLERFGNETTGNSSIALSVPGTTEKVKGAMYTTELTWLLNDTPA